MADKPEKVYLLVYSNAALGTRDEVKNCLDHLPQVLRWRTDLPSSFYVISQVETADELANLLVECIGKKGRFILTELSSNVQGWLVPDTWHFLNRKTRQEVEAEAITSK